MGKISRNVCDKCGHDQISDGSPNAKSTNLAFKKDREMVWVGVAVQRAYQYGPTAQFLDEKAKLLWCIDCCYTNHIVAKPNEPAPTPPTLDEMLEQLVEDKVNSALER